MSLFGTRKESSPKVYWARNWDERLYEAMFARTNETNLVIGHYFSCVLDQRYSKIDSSAPSARTHQYSGKFKLWLSEAEFCEIPLDVSFEDGHEYFDRFINNFTLGFFTFHGTQARSGRPHSAMSLIVKTREAVADQVARLFAEVKAAGGFGVEVNWSTILKEMVGLSAEQVWGNSEALADFDENGKKVTSIPVGRQPFALESINFTAQI